MFHDLDDIEVACTPSMCGMAFGITSKRLSSDYAVFWQAALLLANWLLLGHSVQFALQVDRAWFIHRETISADIFPRND